MKRLMTQLIKFSVVGGTAFIIDYGVLIALTEWAGLNYLISGAISFTASVIYNYIMSIKWVFDVNEELGRKHRFIVFIALSVIGLGINELFMWIFVDKFVVHYMIAKIAATFIVMVYNFISRKIFLEK